MDLYIVYTVTQKPRYTVKGACTTTSASAFSSTCSSFAPSPSSFPLSPGLARARLLVLKNVLSDLFSTPSNVPPCADTYVCNNLHRKHKKVIIQKVKSLSSC